MKNWIEDFCKIYRRTDLSFHITSYSANNCFEMFDYLPRTLHLLGMKIARNSMQQSFGGEVVVLSESNYVLYGKLHQPFSGFVVKFGVGWEFNVFWHYGGVDDNLLEVFNFYCF